MMHASLPNLPKPLIIGVDASRSTVLQKTGTENYSLQMINALIEAKTKYIWRLYYRDNPSPTLYRTNSLVESKVMVSPIAWTHLRLSAELAFNPPDLVFVPAHVIPIYCPAPSVVTIHDLGFMRYPSMHPPLQLAYLRWSTNYNVRHASHLIADSEATKQDIIDHYHTDPAKITVVHPGFDSESYQPTDNKNVFQNLPDSYILHVGTIHPRKGLSVLIKAIAQLRDRNINISLVCAGREGWMTSSIRKQAVDLGLESMIHFIGFVPQKHLPTLYSRAKITVLPSLYEGFGYTTLESMAAATPVICTNAGSLPEVVGKAALIVPPNDSGSLSNAINTLLTNNSIRQRLITAGQKRCAMFSWDSTANQTIAIIEKTLTEKASHVSNKHP